MEQRLPLCTAAFATELVVSGMRICSKTNTWEDKGENDAETAAQEVFLPESDGPESAQ